MRLEEAVWTQDGRRAGNGAFGVDCSLLDSKVRHLCIKTGREGDSGDAGQKWVVIEVEI